MAGWSTKAIRTVLLVGQYRERNRSVERQVALLHRKAVRPASFSPPRYLVRRCQVSAEHVHGQLVYRIRARSAEEHQPPARRLVFLHGGGFVREIGREHWQLVSRLALRLDVEVVVPIYPLAPLGSAAENLPRMVLLYQREAATGTPLDVMGDSAGGGMALALLLEVASAGLPLPGRTVLLSPWVDLTVNDPRVREAAHLDVMLSPAMLEAASRLWAADLPTDDPRVSPLMGDLSTLRGTRLMLLSGTHDILNAEARRLRDLATAAGIEVTYLEEEEQPHIYAALPTPEGRAAAEEIAAFLSARW